MSGARAKVARRPSAPASSRFAAEREAERVGDLAAGRPPVAGWSFAGVPTSHGGTEAPDDARVAAIVRGPGRPIEAAPRNAFEHQLGADLSTVRVHDDSVAAAATRALGAEGLAAGDHVALATGRHDPTSPRSRALLGHELAHVVQQRAAGSPALVQLQGGGVVAPATTLDALPEADRKRSQVVTATVNVPNLGDKFATTGTTTTSAFPSGVTAEFDASVDPSQKHGLENVAGSLSAGQELTPAPLPPNSTVTLELDVPGKGKSLYRFTYHAPPAPPGKGKAAPAPRILIEALAKATPPPGTTAPVQPTTPGAQAVPDPVADKIKKHSLKQSLAGDQLDAFRGAIAQIPDAQLSVVDGLRFVRKGVHPTDPNAAGEYDQKTHTVTIFDIAFAATETRSKGPGTTTSSPAMRAIVHEIGHAIDLASLRKANLAREATESALNALPNPPTTAAEKKQQDDASKAVKDAEKAQLAAESISGTKTVKKGNVFEDVIGKTAGNKKFRQAVAKDGGKAVTAYGDQDFQESFAEAYSLFITSPATLKSVRPNVYDFLDNNLPK